MLLQNKNGYICDCCGQAYQGTFVYYSLDFHAFDCKNNRVPVFKNLTTITFSIDACPSCYALMSGRVVANYKPTNQGVNCDFCAKQLRGDFAAHYVTYAEVTVDFDKFNLVCYVCGNELGRQTPKCEKCGSLKALKLPKVTIKKDVLSSVSCHDDYQKIVDSTIAIKQINHNKE